MVLRLLFEGTRATGIRYSQNGEEKTARAGGEIVLSGGAINSPQLLQLSGVGPAAHLRALGIDVVLDSPGVGRDLQDHYQARTVLELNRSLSVNDDVHNPLRLAWTALRYALFRRGPMTFSAGHVGVFTQVLPDSATPDAQVHFIPFSATKLGGELHRFSGVTASVCQLRPESRGEVDDRLPTRSRIPRIMPNYLSTDYDRRIMVEG